VAIQKWVDIDFDYKTTLPSEDNPPLPPPPCNAFTSHQPSYSLPRYAYARARLLARRCGPIFNDSGLYAACERGDVGERQQMRQGVGEGWEAKVGYSRMKSELTRGELREVVGKMLAKGGTEEQKAAFEDKTLWDDSTNN